jgi:hypothetical protein
MNEERVDGWGQDCSVMKVMLLSDATWLQSRFGISRIASAESGATHLGRRSGRRQV